MLKIDHFYVTVTDMDKAVTFYEKILQEKITHREGNRWADFSQGDVVYLGIYNATIDQESFTTGSSPTLCLKTDDIESEYERIKQLSVESITDIVVLEQPALYKYFWFTDPWGNKWEVAEYNY